MIDKVNDVIRRVGVLLDDPTNSRFTSDYLMPWIDQSYDDLDVELESAGMQYVEEIAVVPLNVDPATGTTPESLAYLNDEGQALETMKFPKQIRWKLQGQPDYMYQPSSGPVQELLEVDTASSFGALQWRFAQGAIQVTPSVTAMTLKIYFDQMSTDIYDPAQNVIRGTAHILAFDVARAVSEARKGQEKRAEQLRRDHMKSWNKFKNVLVRNRQSEQVEAQPIHGKRRMGTPYVSAGN